MLSVLLLCDVGCSSLQSVCCLLPLLVHGVCCVLLFFGVRRVVLGVWNLMHRVS